MFCVLRSYLSTACILLLALWLGGCVSTNPVTIDYDPQADFSSMEAYYLLEPLADDLVSPLEIKRANQAVNALLDIRYYAADSAETADFLVQVQIHAVERIAVYEDPLALYGGYNRWGYWNHWGFGLSAPLQLRQYREASLVVDVLSPTYSPLWRGSLLSRADRPREPESAHQRLREEAALILNQFPPARATLN